MNAHLDFIVGIVVVHIVSSHHRMFHTVCGSYVRLHVGKSPGRNGFNQFITTFGLDVNLHLHQRAAVLVVFLFCFIFYGAMVQFKNLHDFECSKAVPHT